MMVNLMKNYIQKHEQRQNYFCLFISMDTTKEPHKAASLHSQPVCDQAESRPANIRLFNSSYNFDENCLTSILINSRYRLQNVHQIRVRRLEVGGHYQSPVREPTKNR